MVRFPAKLISNGRITIPEDEREELDAEEGDYLLVDVKQLDRQTIADPDRLR